MNILKRIFAGPTETNKIIDGAIAGLDKIVFTEEERADANRKMGDWYLKYLQATEGQNLARRLIAVIVVCLWSALVVFGVAIRWISYDLSDFVFRVLVDIVMQPFTIVIGFYFLTHAVRAYKKD